MSVSSPAGPIALASPRVRATDFLAIMKIRISLLSAFTAAAAYYVAADAAFAWSAFLHTALATFVITAGASALNMYYERATDALMERTRNRPIPAGRMSPQTAFLTGLALSAAGIVYLYFATTPLAAAAGATALVLYVYVYTPSKTMTPLSTIIGAVPGAMPPIMGWAAATGTIGFGATVLFAIMFLWQLPHSLAIAWKYRDDYKLGGIPLLPTTDPTGIATARQMLLYAIALAGVSLLPTLAREAGVIYFAGALISGVWFVLICLRWCLKKDREHATQIFLASLVHLTLLFALLVFDSTA